MSGLFVAAAGILSLATLALLLWPLLRSRRAAPSRAAFDVRLYRDQLAEVERDAARGLLAPAEAEAARTEVKRRLLAAADAGGEAADASPKAGGTGSSKAGGAAPRPRRWLPVAALTLLLPSVAVLLYLELGQPGIPDQPLAERRTREMLAEGTTAEQAASLEEATRKLEQRLEERPNELGGWFLLGRSYLSLQRFPDAVRAACARARARLDDADVVGGYAEAAIAAAGGQIDAAVREALTRLLALDPLSPKARFCSPSTARSRGTFAGASGWFDLVAVSPAAAPWLPTVSANTWSGPARRRGSTRRACSLAGGGGAGRNASAGGGSCGGGAERTRAHRRRRRCRRPDGACGQAADDSWHGGSSCCAPAGEPRGH
ncbi:MAG: c-type cytochrome biogenesis protein CcmI [Rhodospirillales bacterium]